MIVRQINPDHHYEPTTGHILIGYTVRLQSASVYVKKVHFDGGRRC